MSAKHDKKVFTMSTGKAKKFSMREVSFVDDDIAGISKPQAISSDGFPEEMEYVLRLEDRQEVSLHLVRTRLASPPEVFRQKSDGTFDAIQKKKKVRDIKKTLKWFQLPFMPNLLFSYAVHSRCQILRTIIFCQKHKMLLF